MALDELSKHMTDYRNERIKALNNGRRMAWFTSPLKKVSDLVTTVCDTAKPNAAWEKIYLQGKQAPAVDRAKLPGYRAEVAFVAGCRRDLRILFMAGDDNRDRVELDHDRMELQKLNYENGVMKLMVSNIKNKQGVT